ncbi:MAG: hypothetical protein HQL72_08400 [Magnetococcales bacterium]|nr:hypothetical protein [Magnetococcales bacterium]
MCAFSGKKRRVWPWTVLSILMIVMVSFLDREKADQPFYADLAVDHVQEQPLVNTLSSLYTLKPEHLTWKSAFLGVLGFPAVLLQEKQLVLFRG